MATNVVDLMDQQSAEGSRSFVPFFFKLGDAQRAAIRPLLNLDGASEIYFHKVFNAQGKFYVENVCAREIGKKCQICEDALRARDKKSKSEMTAKQMFMLPVWLYVIKAKKLEDGMEVLDENDNPVYEDKTYVSKETGEALLVSGVRVMQLMFKNSSFTKIADGFKDLYKTGQSIADRDFLIQRTGGGTDTSYSISKKNPSPFEKDLDFAVTEEWVRQSCIANYPPQVASDHRARGMSADDQLKAMVSRNVDDDTLGDF